MLFTAKRGCHSGSLRNGIETPALARFTASELLGSVLLRHRVSFEDSLKEGGINGTVLCPKEPQQHLELAAFYPKIAVAYTQIAAIATDDHHTLQEFRASVGAEWTFLSDPDRPIQKDLDIQERVRWKGRCWMNRGWPDCSTMPSTLGEYPSRPFKYRFRLSCALESCLRRVTLRLAPLTSSPN
jgi:hypothetical protein